MKNGGGELKMQRTKDLLLAGIFAAVTAVCAWLTIPLPFTPVPINLALVGPLLAGTLLGAKYGVLSQLVYILLGAIGLPVFAGFTGGAGIIAGPTGGFMIGYVLCAAICGLARERGAAATSAREKAAAGGLAHKKSSAVKTALLMVCGILACYACGLLWFMFLTKATLWASLVACVFPFIIGDAAKIAASCLLVKYIGPVFQ